MGKEITAALIKELRDRTGVGLSKCKEALEEAHGDIEVAISNLRKKGMASAVKKEGRETKEGVIKTCDNATALALIEVSAETDFVVRNEKFQVFADELAKELLNYPSAITVEEFAKKPYSKDPKITIDEHRSIVVQTLGENIQIKRLAIFSKRSDLSLGLYSHGGGKLVSLVELSGSDKEVDLAKDIAMHIAAESPDYLNSEDVPESIIAREKEIAAAQVKGKPAQIVDTIVKGKLNAFFKQVCLVDQPFVKNPDISVGDLVAKKGKDSGSSLKIVKFLRWKAGE